MDENQALLGKDYDSGRQEKCRSYSYQDEYSDEVRGSSSEESEEWWEDSHSSCGSSCCSSASGSSLAWEGEVNENGELFYIESDTCLSSSPVEDDVELSNISPGTKEGKTENEKKGKLVRWMRRRQSKRQRPKLTLPEREDDSRQRISDSASYSTPLTGTNEGMKQVVVKIDKINSGDTLCEKVLGIKTNNVQQGQKVIITEFVFNSPLTKYKEISVGDILRSINDEEVTPQTLDNLIKNITLPGEIFLQLESGEIPVAKDGTKKSRTSLAKRLTGKGKILDSVFEDQPIGLVFVNLEKQTSDKKDIIYSFPSKSVLSSCRGSFITLHHLLKEINSNSCISSDIIIKKQLCHVIYKAEDTSLLLISIPDIRCTVKEAIYVANDLIHYLQFSYQNLHRCFTTRSTADLNHFFSVFFSRVLTSGFSSDAARSICLENIPVLAAQPPSPQFEDILPYASWIPLPKEAQIQIDDALNELEANDFDYEGEDNIENQRLYNIVGSCFYHKGYLIASHLPKDDLLDLHSFCRQNCIIQLMRMESVKSLLIWREVFPSSVNRGLNSPKNNGYTIPKGRWFLLLLGQGYDLLGVILESGGCCVKAEGNPGPSTEYIEEAEDTLRHIQKLGISHLASQWIRDNINCRTITPDDIFFSKTNRKKDNVLSFVKTLDTTARTQGSVTPPNITRNSSDLNIPMKTRTVQTSENSEDSISQAPSNVSEVSDENAPILGRRAERVKNAATRPASDSENSDSDWESFKECSRHDLNSTGSSGILRGFSDFNDIIPSKLTTGPENVLFYYVHLDSNEGVFMSPTVHSKLTPKMDEILDKFRKSAVLIHSLLQNNVRFKKNSQENAKFYINKSLIAVKEHGILLECNTSEQDSNKRVSFAYWVVGRLFFTPQPREVYVCYYDDAPQNLVEIAFRLGLNAAG